MKYFQLVSTQERLFHGFIVFALLMTAMPSTAEVLEETIRNELSSFSNLLTGTSMRCATVLDPIKLVSKVFSVTNDVAASTLNLQNITVSGLSSANLVSVSYDNSSAGSVNIILNVPQLEVTSVGGINGSILSIFPYQFNVSPTISIVNALVNIELCTNSFQVDLSCSNISITLVADSTSLNTDVTDGGLASTIFLSVVQPMIETSLLGLLSPDIMQTFKYPLLEVVACVVSDVLAALNSNEGCLEENVSPNTLIDNILEAAKEMFFFVDPFYLECEKSPLFRLMNGQMIGLSQISRKGNAEMSCNDTEGLDVIYFNLTVPDIELVYHTKAYGIFQNGSTEFRVKASCLMIYSNIVIKGNVSPMHHKNFHLSYPKNITFYVSDNTFLTNFLNSSPIFAEMFRNIIINVVMVVLNFAFKAGALAEYPNMMVPYLGMEDMEYSSSG